MAIRKAELSDLETVKQISEITISEIYSHYYPKGAVEFFLEWHNENSIINDIKSDRVFVCIGKEQNIVGTVTIKENEISRLFVLPKYQKNGYGREMLDYAEKIIFEKYTEIVLDCAFPAKKIYLKRGYKESDYNIIKTNYNDFLCYDTMIKIREW